MNTTNNSQHNGIFEKANDEESEFNKSQYLLQKHPYTFEELVNQFKSKFNIDQYNLIEICGENTQVLIEFLTNIKLYCLIH